MASNPKPVSMIEAQKLCRSLIAKKHGRSYDRLGRKRDVRHYAVIKVEDASTGTIIGHACDRFGYDIEFRCYPAHGLRGFNSIAITPGARGWGGSFPNKDQSMRVVESLLWRIITKAKQPPRGVPRLNPFMDGFYLILTPKNRPVGPRGRDCLKRAAKADIITPAFEKVCLDWHISMKESFPKVKKTAS